MEKFRLIVLLLTSMICKSMMQAQSQDVAAESIASGCDAMIVADSVATAQSNQSFIQRIINYFADSNKKKENKKFDISFIGGPSYTNSTSLSIGIMGSGQYRMNGCEDMLQPSNVTVYGNFSVKGQVALGIEGINFFPDDQYRLNYEMKFKYYPINYWGIGYDECDVDDNETEMKTLQGRINAEFLFRLIDNFYVGPRIEAGIIKAYDIDEAKLHLYHGESLRQHNIGVGLSVQYDSRDNVTNPHRGVYVNATQMFRPEFIGNDKGYSTSSLTVNAYQSVWKGGIIAEQVTGQFNFGSPSWDMLATMDGSHVMRGYYDSRYRDKHMLAAQVELRQYVWKRCGVVVWGGAGSVFHDRDSFENVLPNYGIGFRWEFKKNVNVRLDYGFGKGGQSGFLFNVNEAF